MFFFSLLFGNLYLHMHNICVDLSLVPFYYYYTSQKLGDLNFYSVKEHLTYTRGGLIQNDSQVRRFLFF